MLIFDLPGFSLIRKTLVRLPAIAKVAHQSLQVRDSFRKTSEILNCSLIMT